MKARKKDIARSFLNAFMFGASAIFCSGEAFYGLSSVMPILLLATLGFAVATLWQLSLGLSQCLFGSSERPK